LVFRKKENESWCAGRLKGKDKAIVPSVSLPTRKMTDVGRNGEAFRKKTGNVKRETKVGE